MLSDAKPAREVVVLVRVEERPVLVEDHADPDGEREDEDEAQRSSLHR
jgi:hypothetical protein